MKRNSTWTAYLSSSAAGSLALVLLSACSSKINVGEMDAGNDARMPAEAYDECGNGMDDDGDGLIDEDCYCGAGESQTCYAGTYPHRGVGACRDGVQQCDTGAGQEFGQWGSCEGSVLPQDEACDGVDNDCDGATDEGCPCSAGESRPCGDSFRVAPCTPGTQTCLDDGRWSACEGAVGPSAEACGTGMGDGVDNDCDGQTDEGCGCTPEPEMCGDGVDNDCDGATDEPACTDDSRLDGGVDGGDAGTSGSALPPVCLGTCTTDVAWQPVGARTDSHGGDRDMMACAIPGGGLAIVVHDYPGVRYRRTDATGAIVVDRMLDLDFGPPVPRPTRPFSGKKLGDMVCLADRFVFDHGFYRTVPSDVGIAAFDYEGNRLATRLLTDTEARSDLYATKRPMLALAGDGLYAVWLEEMGPPRDAPSQWVVQRVDARSLEAVGPEARLNPPDGFKFNGNFADLAGREEGVALLYAGTPVDERIVHPFLVTLSGGSFGTTVQVANVDRLRMMQVAWSPGSLAVCWSRAAFETAVPPYEYYCRFLSEDGEPLGPAQRVNPDGRYGFLTVALTGHGCGYKLATYCRHSGRSLCSEGGALYSGDPVAGTWSRISLPVGPNRSDNILGYIPLTARLLLDEARGLVLIGNARSNAQGWQQLHEFHFDCATP